MTIPKIIHQTAPSDTTLWHPSWKKCQTTVQNFFPDYKHVMWDDNQLEKLIHDEYPWFYDHYISFPKTIYRVDSARYAILQTYGGIYIDMDIEVVNKFDHLLSPDVVSIVESPFRETEYCQNSLMSSPRKHGFWTEVFREIMSTYPYYQKSVLDSTGPRMLDRVINRYDGKIHMLPQSQFNPRPNSATLAPTNLFTRHHYSAVWVE